MAILLTDRLRERLLWLASNSEAMQLHDISSYNAKFYAALRSVLAGTADRAELDLVIEGSRGTAADGYAHLLVVEPVLVAEEPFIALRVLGEISEELTQIARSF